MTYSEHKGDGRADMRHGIYPLDRFCKAIILRQALNVAEANLVLVLGIFLEKELGILGRLANSASHTVAGFEELKSYFIANVTGDTSDQDELTRHVCKESWKRNWNSGDEPVVPHESQPFSMCERTALALQRTDSGRITRWEPETESRRARRYEFLLHNPIVLQGVRSSL